MHRSRPAYGLGSILVGVLTASLVFSSGISMAAAQAIAALDGRSFSVTVTACDADQFPDTYCFIGQSMVVEAVQCAVGPAVIVGSRFASLVADQLGHQVFFGGR